MLYSYARCLITSGTVGTFSYTCLVRQHTGFNWHDLRCIPPPHADHHSFVVRCDSCRVVFCSRNALEQHFSVHLNDLPDAITFQGRRYRPYTFVPVLVTSIYTCRLMFDMVAHLTWLAAYIRHPHSTQRGIFPPGEMAFRRRLAQQYPTMLSAAANMTVPDIIRVLLPVYQRWLAMARDALYYQ